MKILYYIFCFTLVQATCFADQSSARFTSKDKMTLYLGIFVLIGLLKKISDSIDLNNKDQNKSKRRPADPNDPIVDQYQRWKSKKNQDQASKNAERSQVGYDYVKNLEQYNSDLEKINRLKDGAKGGSRNDSDYQEYLSELRKPLNPSNNKIVEGLPAGFLFKSKDKSDSIEVCSCARCGGMIESVGLSDGVVYTCPHCEKFTMFKKDCGFTFIETSPCCYCRQQIVIDGLLKKTVVECPHCSKKVKYKGGGNEQRSSFIKIIRT